MSAGILFLEVLCLWCHKQPQYVSHKYLLCHEPTFFFFFFCSSLVKRDQIRLNRGSKLKQKKYFCSTNIDRNHHRKPADGIFEHVLHFEANLRLYLGFHQNYNCSPVVRCSKVLKIKIKNNLNLYSTQGSWKKTASTAQILRLGKGSISLLEHTEHTKRLRQTTPLPNCPYAAKHFWYSTKKCIRTQQFSKAAKKILLQHQREAHIPTSTPQPTTFELNGISKYLPNKFQHWYTLNTDQNVEQNKKDTVHNTLAYNIAQHTD